jgi:type I restriction enzyme S subunit
MAQEWRTVRLGDICNPQQWPTISQAQMSAKGVPVYGANSFIGYYGEANHQDDVIAVSCRGSCGEVAYVKGPSYVTGNSMCLDELNEREVSKIWLCQLLKLRGFRDIISGSAQPQIIRKDLVKVKIHLPPLSEQRKIAEILRTWDEAIETAEAELKAKQERKRWLMDRLFKFSPESHLEQVKMQDAVDVLKGEQLNRHTLAEKGSCPVWNGGITPSGYTESFNTEGPAVIMSEGGNSCGAITRVNENFWRGGHCYHVVPRNGFSNDYIFAALKYYEPQIMRLRVGSGLPNIQKKTFLSWAAPLHKPAYRDKVASVFTHAQLEGELANKHIEILRAQKRGLMQKLLTGEVRVAA